jgi:predicted nucleotidyltransferase
MENTLSSLLFKDYRKRVLGLLLLHPGQRYHVREIARLTNTVAGTLHKELARLAEAGVLTKEAIGNQVYYAANPDCIIFEELASILRKTSGIVEQLSDALLPLEERISLAFVFGSVARGKETVGSDVDLLVIGDVGFADVVKALYPAQEAIGREINPKVYTKAEWQKLFTSKDAFVRDVLDKPKLFVIGKEDELGQLSG